MEQSKNKYSEISGEVAGVVFHSQENGFAVAHLVDDQGKLHTFCGVFPDISIGQPVKLRGVWENNNYGLRLKVEEFEYILPVTKEGLERYLGSGLIPGVGSKLAKSVVEYFGERTIEILDTKPGRLREIEKIGAKTASKIIDGWRKATTDRAQFIFFQSIGLTPSFSRKLLKRYGANAAQTVKANPYKLADDLDGVGFLKADKIAADIGTAPDAKFRLLAGIVYTINKLTTLGHCCYPLEQLLNEAANLLKCDPEKLKIPLSDALLSRQIVREDDMIYPMRLYKAENELPRHIARLLEAKKYPAQRISTIPAAPNLTLNQQQLSALKMAADSPVSIITGGPGVGKTTVLGELVRRAKAAKLDIQLAAPTGRAAKRLADATGHPAKTIHRLLVFDPSTGGFQHGIFAPINCDLLIVDELSMLDLPLALALFQALKKGTAVVLVGDSDQLPSVGPGTVLASFIASTMFPVTRLTEVFRQSAESMIVSNAHRVNSGLLPVVPRSDKLSDFYWIEAEEPDHVTELISKMMIDRIPNRFHLRPELDVQILAPMNRGTCGTIRLNSAMQNLLNPAEQPQFQRGGDSIIKQGDKVMQITNNYDKAVFNGDLGIVEKVNCKEKIFQVLFEGYPLPVQYGFDEAEQLTLAYAITVHKSQGCEFPAVILPLLSQHFMMLQRNLLYTAMTRAKKLLVLIGSEKSVAMAVNNVRMEPRFGNLTKKLSEKLMKF